jgi:ribosomal protein L37E
MILSGKFRDKDKLVLSKSPNTALVNCNACGQPISVNAKVCPSCGMTGSKSTRSPLKIVLYVVGGIFALGIIVLMVDDEDKISSRNPTSSVKTSKAAISLPVDQKTFIENVSIFIPEYKSAPNELKKSAIRTKRKKAIMKALNGNLRINNWIGRLEEMGTNSEGKAIVSIVLIGSNIRVQTWNNAMSDVLSNTLIEQGTSLFNDIAELNNGDKVTFSGTFLSGDNDYIGEQSLTEDGAMTEPEFTFRFESMKKM